MIKVFKDHPIAFLLLLVLVYALFFNRANSSINIWHKISDFLVAVGIISIFTSTNFAWVRSSKNITNKLLNLFRINPKENSHTFDNAELINLSFLVLVSVTIIEYFMEIVLFNNNPPISIGVPYSIYSFSANRILFYGIIYDLILYFLVFKFILEMKKR